MSTREAAVAGLFYPQDVGELRRQVLQLLHDAPARRGPAPKVLIVPHAGYVYSGATAAAAYRCLQGRAEHLRRVVLLGPAHRVYLRGMALPGDSHFTTPLGKVAVDTAALERIHQLVLRLLADLGLSQVTPSRSAVSAPL